jgi:hypothetical protein
MAKFSEEQRVKVNRDATDPSPSSILFDREGAIFQVVTMFDPTRGPDYPKQYMVWFDGDSQPKSCWENQLLAI